MSQKAAQTDGRKKGTSRISRPFIAAIRLYQAYISPLTPPSCRFVSSCSSYGIEAIEEHGIIKGLWLTSLRLLKCHPFSGKSGFDPVPKNAKTNADEKDAQ